MNFVLLFAILSAYLGLCFGVSQPILFHKKVDITIDGITTSYCEEETVRILPDTQLNVPGKCGLWYCTKTFDIRITPCPFDSKLPCKVCWTIFSATFSSYQQWPVNLNGLTKMTRNFTQNVVELKRKEWPPKSVLSSIYDLNRLRLWLQS